MDIGDPQIGRDCFEFEDRSSKGGCMKYNMGCVLASLFVSVLLLGSFAPAQQLNDHVVTFVVPFEFTIGQKTFSAGSYSLVRTEPYLLELRDADRHSLTQIVTRSVEA